MVAPTFVSYQDSGTWATAQANNTVLSVSVTVQTDDVLVIVGGIEASLQSATPVILTLPTGGSLTYTQQQKPNADDDGSHAQTYLWTATATGDDTFDVQSTLDSLSASFCCGIGVYVFGNATLGTPTSVGNEASGSAPSLAITTLGANSTVVYFESDWNATDGTTRTWRTINSVTPTSGNGLEKLYARNSASWSAYGAYWDDVGAAGAVTTGLTAPTGHMGNSVAIEVQGTATAPIVDISPDSWAVVGGAFNRVAVEDDTGDPITVREWTVVSGPADSGTVIGTDVVNTWAPTVTGSYVIRYTATNGIGSSYDEINLEVGDIIEGPQNSSLMRR